MPTKTKKEIVVDTDRVTQYTVTSSYIVVDRFSWGILERVGMFFFLIFDGLESWDMGGEGWHSGVGRGIYMYSTLSWYMYDNDLLKEFALTSRHAQYGDH